jgi:ectoine hydroxylase
MKLTDEQLGLYREQGFVLLREAFGPDEVAALREMLPAALAQEGPARVREAQGGVVRSVYGTHRTHDGFRRLAQDARLVEPAVQVVGDDVYVYQFKINAKAAFAGDVWEWHQDYIFWRDEDGMPAPRVTNVGVFLDEVNEFNGPLFFIPGSQRRGVIEARRPEPRAAGAGGQPEWAAVVSATLRYALGRETVAELSRESGLACPKGPAGSLLLFDPNVVHGSSNNISPYDRVMVIATYNSVHNLPGGGRLWRPEFLVNRDATPVRPVRQRFAH